MKGMRTNVTTFIFSFPTRINNRAAVVWSISSVYTTRGRVRFYQIRTATVTHVYVHAHGSFNDFSREPETIKRNVFGGRTGGYQNARVPGIPKFGFGNPGRYFGYSVA